MILYIYNTTNHWSHIFNVTAMHNYFHINIYLCIHKRKTSAVCCFYMIDINYAVFIYFYFKLFNTDQQICNVRLLGYNYISPFLEKHVVSVPHESYPCNSYILKGNSLNLAYCCIIFEGVISLHDWIFQQRGWKGWERNIFFSFKKITFNYIWFRK